MCSKEEGADNLFDRGLQLARRRCTVRPSSYDDRCNLSSREKSLLRVPVPFSAARVARFLFSFQALLRIRRFTPVPPVCFPQS